MHKQNDNWRLTEFNPNNSRECWIFRKNLAPIVSAQDRNYPFLAYLTFRYIPRDESGLPSIEDESILFRIEDNEVLDLQNDLLSVQVGAVLRNGVKDLLFYTRDPKEFMKRAERFRTDYVAFHVTCEITHDPDWSQYDDFP